MKNKIIQIEQKSQSEKGKLDAQIQMLNESEEKSKV